MHRTWLTVALGAALLVAGCRDGGKASPSPTVQPTPPPLTLPGLTVGRATFYGAQAGDAAGSIVAGDFNGDGQRDVVLAAAVADGPNNDRADSGEAYLFLGPFKPGDTRDAALNEQAFTVYGAAPGDELAREMAAGDLNGDGFDDILLGAPFNDGAKGDRADAGAVFVFLGSPGLGRDLRAVDLARERAHVTIRGERAGDLAGFGLAVADVNGDGKADTIVSSFASDGPDGARPDAGQVYVLYGLETLLVDVDLAEQPPETVVFGAQTGDRLGEDVAAGDVNGDGVADLVLPAPFAWGPKDDRRAVGETYVLFGPADAVVDLAETKPDLVVYGVDGGDQLGHSLGVGDTDGDGTGDLLLGAVSASGRDNALRLAGEAALVSGSARGAVEVAARPAP